MSSTITPPPTHPHFPRQTYNPYADISSIYAEVFSLYPELASYSNLAYDESLYSSYLAELISQNPQVFTDPAVFSFPAAEATATATDALDSLLPEATGLKAFGDSNRSSAGMPLYTKIGIGVGIPLAIALIVAFGIFLWGVGKRRGKQSKPVTFVAPHQPPHQQQQYPTPSATPGPPMSYSNPNSQGYMPVHQPGFQHQQHQHHQHHQQQLHQHQQHQQQQPYHQPQPQPQHFQQPSPHPSPQPYSPAPSLPQYSVPPAEQDTQYVGYTYDKPPQPGVVAPYQGYRSPEDGAVELDDGQPERR